MTRPAHRPRKDYDYEKAKELWNQGRSENKISKELNIPRGTLHRHRDEWMVKVRYG